MSKNPIAFKSEPSDEAWLDDIREKNARKEEKCKISNEKMLLEIENYIKNIKEHIKCFPIHPKTDQSLKDIERLRKIAEERTTETNKHQIITNMSGKASNLHFELHQDIENHLSSILIGLIKEQAKLMKDINKINKRLKINE